MPIDAAIAHLSAWNARRRTERELRALSERQLADIGVAPCEIGRIARDAGPRARGAGSSRRGWAHGAEAVR